MVSLDVFRHGMDVVESGLPCDGRFAARVGLPGSGVSDWLGYKRFAAHFALAGDLLLSDATNTAKALFYTPGRREGVCPPEGVAAPKIGGCRGDGRACRVQRWGTLSEAGSLSSARFKKPTICCRLLLSD